MRRSQRLLKRAAPAEDEVQGQGRRKSNRLSGSDNDGQCDVKKVDHPEGLFAHLPNELVEKIFNNLSFKEAFLFANVSKRLRAFARRSYIDTWTMNEKPRWPVRHSASTNNSLVLVYLNGAVDFFEYAPNDPNQIYRTASCKEGTLSKLNSFHLAIIPNTKCIVFQHLEAKIIVFDVGNARKLTECEGIRESVRVETDIVYAMRRGAPRRYTTRIVASSRAIAVVYGLKKDPLLHVYAWNGREAELVRTMPTIAARNEGTALSISSGGLLVYQSRDSQVRLWDTRSDTEVGRIDIGCLVVSRFALCTDATRLAVSAWKPPCGPQPDPHVCVYDVSRHSGSRRAAMPLVFQTARGGSSRDSDDAIYDPALSSDGRALLLRSHDVKIARIVFLDGKEGDREISVRIPDLYYYNRVYREINGIPHLQLTTGRDELKLIRLCKADKQSSAIEKNRNKRKTA